MPQAKTLIIIDDEPAIRNGIFNIIQNSNIPKLKVIAQASNGIDGLNLINQLHPDIVISDIIMPGITGLELIKEVRKKNDSTEFIIISGYDDFKFAQQALQLKVNNYLLKPISKTDLIESVNKIIININSSITTNVQSFEQLQKSAITLFMQRIIKGEIQSEKELLMGLNSFDIPLYNKETTCITLNCQTNAALVLGNENFNNYCLKNNLYFIKEQNNLVTLINCQQDSAYQKAKSILNFLLKERITFIIIGIGSTEQTPLEALKSYQKSLISISYKIYNDDKFIFTQNDISKALPQISTHQIDTSGIITLLKNGNDEQITNWCNAFFNQILFIQTPPPSYVRGMCIFLITDIQRQLSKSDNVDKHCFDELDFSTVNEILSITNLKEWILSYLLKIKHKILPEAIIYNDPIIFKTIKYVEENIRSRNISAQEISNKLGLNDTYFSTYFKSKTGNTFRSYVLIKKDEYAKELLHNCQLTLDDIACDLGYTDYRSFHRIFKQLNDISPTEYRKKIKNET